MISQTELKQLESLISREGGFAGFVRSLASAWGDAKVQEVLNEVGADLSLGIKDWSSLKSKVTSASSIVTLDSALRAVSNAISTKNAAMLGPALAVATAVAARESGISLLE